MFKDNISLTLYTDYGFYFYMDPTALYEHVVSYMARKQALKNATIEAVNFGDAIYYSGDVVVEFRGGQLQAFENSLTAGLEGVVCDRSGPTELSIKRFTHNSEGEQVTKESIRVTRIGPLK